MSDGIRTTPYCDRHAEPVKIVADTYDPEALVVPKRKAVNLEIEAHDLCIENARLRRELNAAQMCLKEIVSQIVHVDGDVWQLTCCSTDEVDRWRLASAGKDTNDRGESGSEMNRTVQDLVGTEYQFSDDFADTREPSKFKFVRMNSPFYDGERWAVRWCGLCLTKTGEWIYEPMPSSRDAAFYTRCRFDTLKQAVETWNCANARLTGKMEGEI